MRAALDESRPSMHVWPNGRFEARAQAIDNLIRVAYGFEHADPRDGMVRMPRSWPDDERYDITAGVDATWAGAAAEPVSPQLREMLRALLESRFGVRTSTAIRQTRVQAMRLAVAGKPGPKLTPSRGDCLGPYAPEQEPGKENSPPRCPFRFENGIVEAGAVTMTDVARLLARFTDLTPNGPIVDRTGLEGLFDLRLIVSTRGSVLRLRGEIEQQLGIELERTTAAIPTLVVERVERPRED